MKKIITTIVLGLAVTSAFSQLNWRKGGNNAGPPGSQATIGTDASWNSPLGIITNGVQRMQIRNGGTTPNAGRVLLGNNLPPFFIARARLHLHQTAGLLMVNV